jgi:hypothetical protein
LDPPGDFSALSKTSPDLDLDGTRMLYEVIQEGEGSPVASDRGMAFRKEANRNW